MLNMSYKISNFFTQEKCRIGKGKMIIHYENDRRLLVVFKLRIQRTILRISEIFIPKILN